MNVTVDGRTVALAEHGDLSGAPVFLFHGTPEEEYRLRASAWQLDWAAVTTPVEIFQGDEDTTVPTHHAEDIVSRLPAGIGRRHRLPGLGHLSIQDHVAGILDALATP